LIISIKKRPHQVENRIQRRLFLDFKQLAFGHGTTHAPGNEENAEKKVTKKLS
jgi:hypothetical protein